MEYIPLSFPYWLGFPAPVPLLLEDVFATYKRVMCSATKIFNDVILSALLQLPLCFRAALVGKKRLWIINLTPSCLPDRQKVYVTSFFALLFFFCDKKTFISMRFFPLKNVERLKIMRNVPNSVFKKQQENVQVVYNSTIFQTLSSN